MRLSLVILGICVFAGAAVAEKPAQEPVTVTDVACAFESVTVEVNFGQDPGELTAPNRCDPGGGSPVWAWGPAPDIPPPPAPYGPNVWGTVIGGDYPSDAGDGLISPPFPVTVGESDLIELVHYVYTETNYDGCNVVVVAQSGETVLVPIGGYPATISTSASYYAWCVDLEEGWTGNLGWMVDCADLTPWAGQTIQLRLDFGSDSSVTYPGWYLAGYTFGTDEPVAVEPSTWGRIKNVY